MGWGKGSMGLDKGGSEGRRSTGVSVKGVIGDFDIYRHVLERFC